MRARYSGPCASHHLGAVRGDPGIVGMLGELGNKVFRHVGLPPEHDFQCGGPLLRRCGCFSFCIRHGIELPTYSAKGAWCRKSTDDTRVYPGTYFMPKSAMKLSLVVFG